jgi:uncharacterized membrane protein
MFGGSSGWRKKESSTDPFSTGFRTDRTIAGTIGFVGFQLALVWLWVLINTGAFRSIPAFDPYPFVFLATVLAFEGVLLTAFVLIRQNRMSARADRRNHLQLQINLLSEQEVTKVIQMLERMSRQMGIEGEVTDRETKELAADTAIEGIADELRNHLEKPGPSKVTNVG